MPFHPPSTTSNISLCNRHAELSDINYSDSRVVATDRYDILRVRMTLDGGYPRIESMSIMYVRNHGMLSIYLGLLELNYLLLTEIGVVGL